jgi:hypothetical protein
VVKADATSAGIGTPANPTPHTRRTVIAPAKAVTLAFGLLLTAFISPSCVCGYN